MQPHEQRVIAERDELNEKLGKLKDFLGTDFYNGLPGEDQELLAQQSLHMQAYSDTLECRIARFS